VFDLEFLLPDAGGKEPWTNPYGHVELEFNYNPMPYLMRLVFCFLDRAFSLWKTKINQQNAQINSGLIYY